ncbi:MAG TPA: DNA-processing protein DprA [Fibrobacter sp.]|nr:DNA-processing protein DprA [Fibrobacter sp.]
MNGQDSKNRELSIEEFPEELQKSKHCPKNLFIKGTLPHRKSVGIALVGTRRPSASAPLLCDLLVKSLRGTNAVVISGLAQGIDSYCHEAALKYNVPTIAVLAQGLETKIGGSREVLAQKILDSGGALLSLYPGNTAPNKWQFPLRNCIIAGCSKTTVVVESRAKGGALITAELCLKDNRKLLAIPGDFNRETAAGTNALLKSGRARALFAPEDLAYYCGVTQHDATTKDTLLKAGISISEEANELLKKVAGYTYTIEELQEKVPFELPTLLSILTELEIAGIAGTSNRFKFHFSPME